MFPVSIEGSIRADIRVPAEAEVVTQQILDDLRRQGIAGALSGTTISFVNDRRWIHQELHFRRFLIVDSGMFAVGPESIQYRLSTALTLLMYSAVMVLPLAFFLATGRFSGALGVIVFWLMVTGGLYFSAALRIRRALQQIADQHLAALARTTKRTFSS